MLHRNEWPYLAAGVKHPGNLIRVRKVVDHPECCVRKCFEQTSDIGRKLAVGTAIHPEIQRRRKRCEGLVQRPASGGPESGRLGLMRIFSGETCLADSRLA